MSNRSNSSLNQLHPVWNVEARTTNAFLKTESSRRTTLIRDQKMTRIQISCEVRSDLSSIWYRTVLHVWSAFVTAAEWSFILHAALFPALLRRWLSEGSIRFNGGNSPVLAANPNSANVPTIRFLDVRGCVSAGGGGGVMISPFCDYQYLEWFWFPPTVWTNMLSHKTVWTNMLEI